MRTLTCLFLGVFAAGCDPSFDDYTPADAQPRTVTPWSAYGGSGGMRYASDSQISRENVADLELAWIYRTSDVSTVFQATPITVAGQLVFCTPFNRVIALDPLTGGELWQFDPEIDREARPANEFNCRGVATWEDAGVQSCSQRVFTATNDARLIALDAETGQRCSGFGDSGEVDLTSGVGDIQWAGEYQVTSPPAIVGDVVVVGSAVSDGNRVTAPSGVVRGYDALTGVERWAFDLAPPGFDYESRPVSDAGHALGTPNVWAAMSVDADRDLVFLPTGNPSPDYDRPDTQDLSHFGSSVVALRGSTGEVMWHFQTVIRDLWDFDIPAQPVLADVMLDGERVPLLIQATKMGFIFVLNRETGEPVIEVTYQDVPVHGPLAEQLSPVQPFPPEAFQTSRSYKIGESLLGLCDGLDADSASGPVYTPITEQWTIGLPSNMGAINWGGVAVDPERGLIAVNTNSVPFRTKLINREQASDLLEILQDQSRPREERQAASREFRERYDLPDGAELAPQRGTNHLMSRHPYLDPYVGIPCAGLPLSEMMVIDITGERQLWRRPHGTVREVVGMPFEWGAPGMGGPLVTSTGLVFIGGASEHAFRAYDIATGEELWHHRLPSPGAAIPMTYSVTTADGPRQMVVIAAGGDERAGIGSLGDYLIGFALPQEHP